MGRGPQNPWYTLKESGKGGRMPGGPLGSPFETGQSADSGAKCPGSSSSSQLDEVLTVTALFFIE